MKYLAAIKASTKYNILALLPTIFGIVVIGVTGWTGLVEPIVAALEYADLETIANGDIFFDADIRRNLVVAGVLGGYLIHRIGRTALLFRIHGAALEASLAAQETSTPPVASPPIRTGDADSDDDTEHTDDSADEAGAELTVDETDTELDDDAEEETEQTPDDVIASIKDNLNMDDGDDGDNPTDSAQ